MYHTPLKSAIFNINYDKRYIRIMSNYTFFARYRFALIALYRKTDFKKGFLLLKQ